MKKEIKYFMWAMGMGMGLVMFAYGNFVTKDQFHLMAHKINQIYDHLLGKVK